MRRLALLLVSAALITSCTGFPRGWSEAKRTTPPDAVSGAWLGTWHSETSGHSGGLRCVVDPPWGPEDNEVWHFRYRASWAKILCAGFSMDATVKPDDTGGHIVRGSKDLGKIFGGVFTCSGTIRDGLFRAGYEAKLDRGTMELRRVN